MIVEFSVKNFRSIKELQTISFVATALKSPDDFSVLDTNNLASVNNMKLLKTIGIYGANASGKSNIIRALEYFLQAIKNEPSSESNLNSLCDPFLYQENPYETEIYFQIILIVNKKKYRYGFTVKRNPNERENINESYSNEIIAKEWLFGTKDKNLVELFTRTDLKINKEKLPNNEKIPQIPYKHAIFLTHVAAFDSKSDCAEIRKYISGWTISNFSKGLEPFRWNALLLIEKENKEKDFINLLKAFNLDYNRIFLEREEKKPKEEILNHDKIFLEKTIFVNDYKQYTVKLNLKNNESAGTQKLFDIAGLLLRAFNMPVSVLVIIDEIDSNFHPSLLIKLIELFNNPLINKNNSQILFTSHDTNLMSPAILRRDQIYFTEKKDDESTKLYSLADLKGIRNDADFAKQYLAGFYGAVPILQNYLNQNSDEIT